MCLASPQLAHADTSVAEQLFQQGLAAMNEEDYATACDAFAGSNRADPSPGTQINLALCFERQKKWASAWGWYRSAAGLAQQRGQTERVETAEEAAKRLAPQLHYLVVSAPESLEELSVTRGGVHLPVAVGGKETPLPVDPGEHTIEVTARGKRPWSTVIVIPDEPGTAHVDVPPLADVPPEASDTFVAPPPPVAANDGSTQRLVGIAVGGAGIAAGVAAGGVYLLARSVAGERNKIRREANDMTDPAAAASHHRIADSKHRAAEKDQIIAISLAGGAAVLVGVGAVLYFTAPKAGTEKGAAVAPLVGPGFAGLSLGGAF